ncbi:MerR family transcriptional regulator [Corynebacterium pacaense]|uniref:MerR family transcriptional regulator n=1 Tax=Corynebacterium pacaense TaxID=1816684 RepID=UPI0009BB4114|nr:MerR family transcriptional regulator [Corynebacterium pacaense]
MRIGELARAAHCSVRAIRHYHEVGALPEPRRTGSGYREYTVDDILETLRIRALVQAGVPLSATGDRSPSALRDALDSLGEKIEKLTVQRDRLRQLMTTTMGVPTDIARIFVELAEHNEDIADLIRQELSMLQLMALSDVTTHESWERIRGNLQSLKSIDATLRSLRIWKLLESTSEDALITEYLQLAPLGYLADVPLAKGTMPLTIEDLAVSRSQAALLRRML